MIFLRPWFLILICVPILFWLFRKKIDQHPFLEQFIDKRLLPFLTVSFHVGTYQFKVWRFILFWSILVVAGAGPAIEKITVPAQTAAPADVVVLDLSESMAYERLSQAKVKLHDMLTALQGHQVGLVLYDEQGYVAVPLTQDLQVIRNLIPSLNPSVMPRSVNRPAVGLLKAQELLHNASVPKGHIIYITAGGFDATGLSDVIKDMPHHVSILGIGDGTNGYPVTLQNGDFMRDDTGAPILVKPDGSLLSQIGTYIAATADDSDIARLLDVYSEAFGDNHTKTENQVEIYQDLGPYLLLFVAPFLLSLFRKGIFFILMLGITCSAHAGLFERADQTQYRLMNAGVEAYRNAQYQQAQSFFAQGQTADDWYNLGNSKAQMQDINGAIEAYQQALKINPSHANAKWNKEYLEKQIPPRTSSEQQSSENSDGQSEQQSSNTSDGQSESQQSSENSDGQSEQQSSKSSDGQSETQQNNQNSANQNMSQQKNQQEQFNQEMSPQHQDMKTSEGISEQSEMAQSEQKDNAEDNQEQSESQETDSNTLSKTMQQRDRPQNNPEQSLDQETEQLFNKIKQDPYRLLRYRLHQQYQRNG